MYWVYLCLSNLSLTYTVLSVQIAQFQFVQSFHVILFRVHECLSQTRSITLLPASRESSSSQGGLFLLIPWPLSDTCFTGSTGHIYIVNDNAMSGCWQCDDKLPSCFLDWWSWEINTALLHEQSTIYDIGLLFIWQLLFTKNQFRNMATKIYSIICLKSVDVRTMQFAILAQSRREMSQTDRIHPRYFL